MKCRPDPKVLAEEPTMREVFRMIGWPTMIAVVVANLALLALAAFIVTKVIKWAWTS